MHARQAGGQAGRHKQGHGDERGVEEVWYPGSTQAGRQASVRTRAGGVKATVAPPTDHHTHPCCVGHVGRVLDGPAVIHDAAHHLHGVLGLGASEGLSGCEQHVPGGGEGGGHTQSRRGIQIQIQIQISPP